MMDHFPDDMYNIILLVGGIIVLIAGILPTLLKGIRIAMPVFFWFFHA